MSETILKVSNLTRTFRVGGFRSRGTLHAIDDVSFEVRAGQIVALVGESGSGPLEQLSSRARYWVRE